MLVIFARLPFDGCLVRYFALMSQIQFLFKRSSGGFIDVAQRQSLIKLLPHRAMVTILATSNDFVSIEKPQKVTVSVT